jgi:hypothetical protein
MLAAAQEFNPVIRRLKISRRAESGGRAPEMAIYCASGRSSLRAATLMG